MSVPYLLALRGHLVVKGKKPDGDSMRFVPDDPRQLDRLERADRIDVSADGSVQLRFEGIDAPETHYGTLAQPLGEAARDRLLALAGFTDVAFDEKGTATSASPDRVEVTVLTKRAEANGRPVAYVLPAGGRHPRGGRWANVDASLLRRTLNAAMLEDGMGYMTLYTSTPAEHARVFRKLTAGARERGEGVWREDATREFALVDQASIAPGGQLVLPKLFRRCSDYLKAVAGGFAGTLDEWLVDVSLTGRRPEDDRLLVCGGTEVTLSGVVQQRNSRIRFPADLLDIVFVEK